jgi:hypothetical protein
MLSVMAVVTMAVTVAMSVALYKLDAVISLADSHDCAKLVRLRNVDRALEPTLHGFELKHLFRFIGADCGHAYIASRELRSAARRGFKHHAEHRRNTVLEDAKHYNAIGCCDAANLCIGVVFSVLSSIVVSALLSVMTPVVLSVMTPVMTMLIATFSIVLVSVTVSVLLHLCLITRSPLNLFPT